MNRPRSDERRFEHLSRRIRGASVPRAGRRIQLVAAFVLVLSAMLIVLAVLVTRAQWARHHAQLLIDRLRLTDRESITGSRLISNWRWREALVLALALAAAVPAPASAEPAVALLTGNTLISFDTATPQTTTTVPVTGLGVNEALGGIDVRPADSLLYGVTATTGSASNSVLRTYRIDPTTGAATLMGATASGVAGAADVPGGLDFNPVADRIRYVNTNDESLRLVPVTGALAANDTDLTPFTVEIIGAAYDRSVAGAAASTLYAINRNTSRLAMIGGVDGTPSANGGVVTDIGSGLGFTISSISDGGFDISPAGAAVAALTPAADGITRLYTIDLATGVATAVGRLGLGTAVRGLAVLPSPAPPPPAAPALDRTAPNVLVSVPGRARLTAKAIRKIRIAFSCTEACTATGRLRVGKKTIAAGTAALGSADVGSLTLSTTAAQRRAIKRLHRRGAKRRRASLVLTFSDAAGNARQVTRRLTLRR
jgi:Domain of unknown function (DUF4394)